MAHYDVYPAIGGAPGYLLDLQSDYLEVFDTRVVVPLLPPGLGLRPSTRLNPTFQIEGEPHIMETQWLSAVPRNQLLHPIASLVDQHDRIMIALDMLFTGV